MRWPKLAFLTFFGLYFGCSAALADVGFWPVAAAPDTSQAVRAAASKVLRIWTPIEYKVFGPEKYESILRALDEVKIENVRQRATYEMMRIDVRRCLERHLPACRVTNTVAWGSAFILEDGSLISVRHIFSKEGEGLRNKFLYLAQDWARDSVVPAEQARVTQDIAAFKRNPMHDLVFILTDAQENIVFNSGLQKFRVLRFGFLTQFRGTVDLGARKVALDGQDPKIETADYSGADWIDGDGVRIQLESDLPVIKAGTRQSCMAGRVAIAGFPGRNTTSRAAFGGREGVEGQLSLSTGNILSLAETARRAWEWTFWKSYVEEVRGRQVLLTDADATHGMSGGPILNVRGEACGHVKAGYPKENYISQNPSTGLIEMFSFGVPLENLTGI